MLRRLSYQLFTLFTVFVLQNFCEFPSLPSSLPPFGWNCGRFAYSQFAYVSSRFAHVLRPKARFENTRPLHMRLQMLYGLQKAVHVSCSFSRGYLTFFWANVCYWILTLRLHIIPLSFTCTLRELFNTGICFEICFEYNWQLYQYEKPYILQAHAILCSLTQPWKPLYNQCTAKNSVVHVFWV